MQNRCPRVQFDVASQPIAGGRDRDDDHQPAGAVVEDIDGHHDRGSSEGWLVTDRLAEIDVVDLSSPDQASASHSRRSARYCSHRSGSLRRCW